MRTFLFSSKATPHLLTTSCPSRRPDKASPSRRYFHRSRKSELYHTDLQGPSRHEFDLGTLIFNRSKAISPTTTAQGSRSKANRRDTLTQLSKSLYIIPECPFSRLIKFRSALSLFKTQLDQVIGNLVGW